MMTYEEVLDVIAESEIADDERTQWLDLLPELDDEQLNSVGEMFEKQIVEKEALTQRQELELLAMIKKVEDESQKTADTPKEVKPEPQVSQPDTSTPPAPAIETPSTPPAPTVAPAPTPAPPSAPFSVDGVSASQSQPTAAPSAA